MFTTYISETEQTYVATIVGHHAEKFPKWVKAKNSSIYTGGQYEPCTTFTVSKVPNCTTAAANETGARRIAKFKDVAARHGLI